MNLSPGTRLGAYEVSSLIGAGGMGEVYRATDTKLGRDVALKVLPPDLARDAGRLARFEREARLLAALNHPNIAHIYGFESSQLPDGSSVHFLAMELVPGEDLAQRLERDPLPMDQALTVAEQILAALENAHTHGIIHRDLKPANINLTPDGKVKVLDFGLAKALQGESAAEPELSHSPTLTLAATQAGSILGTAAYMSPEQARGQAVDRRSDIWAFGVVFYEMLVGRRLFEGETVSDVLAAVLTRQPDWGNLPGTTPPSAKRLLRRCLEKSVSRRLHDAADVRLEIEEAQSELLQGSEVPPPAGTGRGGVVYWILGLLLVAAGFVAGRWTLWDSEHLAGQADVVLTVGPSDVERIDIVQLGFSNDGRRLVFSESLERVWGHELDGFEPRLISEIDGVSPFISPDGEWIGFFSEGKLKKIQFDGGPTIPICDAPLGGPGATWEEDGFIYFTRTYTSGLLKVHADGGEAVQLTVPDQTQGEGGHMWADLLPGGRFLVFTVFGGIGMYGSNIALLDLESLQYQVLFEGAGARYVSSGHLLFYRRGSYYLVPFDPELGKVSGTARGVLRDVRPPNPTGGELQFSFSRNGHLAFVTGESPRTAKPTRLEWVSRDGSVANLPFEGAHDLSRFALSPDSQKVATSVYSEGEQHIWIYDLLRGTRDEITRDGVQHTPSWHPDGKRVVYTSLLGGNYDLWGAAIDGSAPPGPLVSTEHDEGRPQWSPDGNSLLFQVWSQETGPDIVLARLDDPDARESLVATPLDDSDFHLSGDGEWLAYHSGDGLYVSPFPSGASRTLIARGTRRPRWSAATKELFFLSGDDLMVVSYEIRNGSFQPANPRRLFSIPEGGTIYDVTPDGQRFLFLVLLPDQRVGDRIRIRLNGFEELRALSGG